MNLLDKHEGARELIVLLDAKGATRADMAKALAAEFNIKAPTTRSLTAWLNGDRELVEMRREARRRAALADDDADPADALSSGWHRNPAVEDAMLLAAAEECPEFAQVLVRCGPPSASSAPPAEVWGYVEPTEADASHDAAYVHPDLIAVLESPDDIRAACLRVLPDGWDEPAPEVGAGRLAG